MIYKILICVLIITIVILLGITWIMVHLLSARKANVEPIFSNIVTEERDRKIRDIKWQDRQWLLNLPYEKHSIKAFDGVVLKAKYVKALTESDKCVICVHGFHSNGYKDFSTIGKFYLENGINVLFVDQRGNGESGGNFITYGHKEQQDILDWIEYADKKLTDNRYFALHGISMGSATVMLVSDRVDPAKFKYIAADCGYTVEKTQLLYTIKNMKLPAHLLYGLYSFGCNALRQYNPGKIAPIEHVKKCTVPMIFAHGKNDQVVPAEMACELYEACPNSKKRLVVAEDANHTQAFYMTEEYGKALLELMEV